MNLVVPVRTKYAHVQDPVSLLIPQRNKGTEPSQDTFKNVHCCFTYGSRELETTPMSMDSKWVSHTGYTLMMEYDSTSDLQESHRRDAEQRSQRWSICVVQFHKDQVQKTGKTNYLSSGCCNSMAQMRRLKNNRNFLLVVPEVTIRVPAWSGSGWGPSSGLQTLLHRMTIWPSNSSPRYVPKTIENRSYNKNTNVHSSTIHGSQKLGSNQLVGGQTKCGASIQQSISPPQKERSTDMC